MGSGESRLRWVKQVMGRCVFIASIMAATGMMQACTFNNEGITPPAKVMNYPVAVALSPRECESGPCWLYVANANFDLRYNHGTVQSVDLERLHVAIDDCGEPPCTFPDLDMFIRDGHEVLLGSFANGLVTDRTGSRLFLPIGSSGTLAYVRVRDDGTLDCGGGIQRHICTADFNRGRSRQSRAGAQVMLRNPVSVFTNPLPESLTQNAQEGASYIVTGHATGGASLFVDELDQQGHLAPRLIDVYDQLDDGLTALRFDPLSAQGLATNRLRPRLSRVGVAWDDSAIEQSYLFDLGSLQLRGLDDGSDTRDVWIDEPTELVYIVSRRPNALLVAERSDSLSVTRSLRLRTMIGLARGPSRLVVGRLGSAGRAYAFVSCFDAALLYVIDLELNRFLTIVPGAAGPFDLVIDQARSRLYIADFTSSVVRVIDLRPLEEGRSPELVATVGTVRTVRELL